MSLKVYQYPRCGTCRKAVQYLKEKEIAFEDQHIVENPPSRVELEKLVKKSGLPVRKFFNTSGKKYRELGLKDRLKEMDESEMLDLLASDGMLIKRPIITDGENVTVGFKEETFDEVWRK
ncbi:arsenate reductase family protein [Melghirimyces algeriensis]|uniref:Arsenate reductase n=1 Tax=Melghirimyces algeriensis TaxID=910412 RepID=A0A521DNV9_9BACL|nr:arsenate reductase family protein [Melghirimyces algeriensis]SMO73386.1 arsenate reductase [Melghirimyces algeriensis]